MHASDTAHTYDAAVVGGGPAGLTAAIAMARAGVRTVLIAGPRPIDNRTTALLAGSVAALQDLGVWPHCAGEVSPLAAIRIIDDLGGLVRAPEVLFRADEIALDAFGHSIENAKLLAALQSTAEAIDTLSLREGQVASVDLSGPHVRIAIAGGESVSAQLLVAADGRNSLCRAAAGIAVDRWNYPQAAVSCTLNHTRPHQNISTEFHTGAGPFTLVPLAGQRSSLVWVVEPARAEELRALPPEDFCRAAETQAHSILGKMTLAGERIIFPLSGQNARRLTGPRVVLVGEAAHVLPPIGAQGFNLGLRDAVAIGALAGDALRNGEDIGGDDLTARYQTARQSDINTRVTAVDLLNRSLLTGFIPAQSIRGLGLSLLNRVGPLRRALMREGVGAQQLAEKVVVRS